MTTDTLVVTLTGLAACEVECEGVLWTEVAFSAFSAAANTAVAARERIFHHKGLAVLVAAVHEGAGDHVEVQGDEGDKSAENGPATVLAVRLRAVGPVLLRVKVRGARVEGVALLLWIPPPFLGSFVCLFVCLFVCWSVVYKRVCDD